METTQSPRVRPEVILGIFAAAAAILVAVMAVLCLPYYFENDDPEVYVHQSGLNLLPPTEATEAPTEPEETMEPTMTIVGDQISLITPQEDLNTSPTR